MYPILRMVKEFAISSAAPPLGLMGTHVSRHICWPLDLDIWMELNNGCTLTLFDIGRIPLAKRTGLMTVLRSKRWGIAVAGASVRYRRRIRMFEKFEMRSRMVGWDDRFFYIDQALWRKGECTTQALYRMAVTSAEGIVPMGTVLAALGTDEQTARTPQWVRNWIDAKETRPWPPLA